jgi:hypothetical protein
MGSANVHLASWSLGWRQLWEKLAPRCGCRDCVHSQNVWKRLRRTPQRVVIQGSRYCLDGCLERALTDALRQIRTAPELPAPHRIPLGLLLLSRQQLSAQQLRVALEAQRAAGRGRIGEWLQTLRFASEQQVTAALARQWSCPVLRSNLVTFASARAPRIPVTLLRSFVMFPVDYVEATATLHIAFGEGIDYSVLYAIERMLGCHTEPCMAVPSLLHQHLQTVADHRGESEVVFDRVADTAERARIIRSYSDRLSASEIRLASCGPHVWARVFCDSRPPLDLLLRSARPGSSSAWFPAVTATAPAV